MKYLIVLFLMLLLLTSTSGTLAQGKSKTLSIAPCLSPDAVTMNLDWNWDKENPDDTSADEDEPRRRSASEFALLEGEAIKWLGYSPKSSPNAEWYGGTNPNYPPAGFGGVDMHYYGVSVLITFYNAKDELVGRVEGHYYTLTQQMILYFTNLVATADRNGNHMGYHIYAYPNTYNRIACMFFIDRGDFNYARGVK